MQGDGQHEEPDATQTPRFGSINSRVGVLVWREFIHAQHEHDTERHAENDRGGAEQGATGNSIAGLEAGQNQRERAGGQHHARGEAEQTIFNLLRQAMQKEAGNGAGRRQRETGKAAPERIAQGRAVFTDENVV